MSDPEGFLTRWSRRKREVAEDEAAAAETPHTDAATETSEPPPFDPASVPPIDSINAETDLRAFFAPGVPADLLHAALRRAWASDPKIRDFVGLSENAWDFNTPGAIPGFGPLDATDEIGRVVAQTLDETVQKLEPFEPTPAETAGTPASTRLSDGPADRDDRAEQIAARAAEDQPEEKTEKEAASAGPTELPEVNTAVQHKTDALQYAMRPTRRAHGRALPE